MQYRTYGQTGIQLSVLGFGAGRFPVSRRDFDIDHVAGVLRHAFDRVDIPGNLRAMVEYRVWGLHEHARGMYARLGKERKWRGKRLRRWAEACVACGECEPRCPQNIPIRERLRETAMTLGGE